ncbi:cache domain-containing protein [Pseudoalteromonas phenolica]|uniref:cache domain-containing protein n=1 Tax=Pseudoalteromonas phenolica TaxID=161398 RepID=UPI0013EE617F|nr:cache domain-containing protein [Pseudoalteromonas phenolica]
MSPVGNLILSVTAPVFDDNKRYLGFVGGAIYLQEDNILNQILDKRHHNESAYTYVVDKNRHIIFHKNVERIGEKVSENRIVDTVLSGVSGSMIAKNSLGLEMIAGYAPAQLTNWGIVSQSHKSVALEKVYGTITDVVLSTLPLMVLTLLIIILLAMKIAEPLASLAQALKEEGLDSKIDPRKITAWYFEADYLKKAFISSHERIEQTILKLDQDSQNVQLTQLLNRRGMEKALATFKACSQPFAVLALDIDHLSG